LRCFIWWGHWVLPYITSSRIWDGFLGAWQLLLVKEMVVPHDVMKSAFPWLILVCYKCNIHTYIYLMYTSSCLCTYTIHVYFKPKQNSLQEIQVKIFFQVPRMGSALWLTMRWWNIWMTPYLRLQLLHMHPLQKTSGYVC